MPLQWQRLDLVQVLARPSGLWTLALEYVAGSRLLRTQIVAADANQAAVEVTWFVKPRENCGADGIVRNPAKTGLLCAGAPYGALVGKLGGSTADVPDPTPALAATPYGSKRVFAIGSRSVINLGATDGAPLFLTMNDSPEDFHYHEGALHVLIEYYPL